MKAIYLDCFSGISGNMLLGAFLDGGVSAGYLEEELHKLKIGQEFSLKISQTTKQGIHAIYVEVHLTDEHHHASHDQEHHHHRNLADITDIIEGSGLNERVKTTSLTIFQRLAAAEAKVHGTSIGEVHFHEVGAVDSIVDIVGTAICLDHLNIDRIFTSRLNVGSGFIKCAHGTMPVPAPATAEILKGIPFYAKQVDRELVTPTGAAIVAALADTRSFDLPDDFRYHTVSYGAGTWDLACPNVLRLYIGEIMTEQAENEKKK